MSFWYKFCRFIGKALLLLLPVKLTGSLPENGPLILIANHPSFLDPPLLVIKFDKQLLFAAKVQVFQWKLIGRLIHLTGSALPVAKNSLTSLRPLAKLIEQGATVVIFPAGGGPFRLKKMKKGFIWLAKETGVQIVPIGISGTNFRSLLKAPSRIEIKIGEPFVALGETDEKELIVLSWQKISSLLSQG